MIIGMVETGTFIVVGLSNQNLTSVFLRQISCKFPLSSEARVMIALIRHFSFKPAVNVSTK